MDCDEEVELALGRLHLGDTDVKIADRVALELFSTGLASSTSGSRVMP